MFKLLKKLIKLIVIIAFVFVLVIALARLPLGPVSNIAKAIETEIVGLLDRNDATREAAQQIIDAETDALAKAANITTEKASEILGNISIAGWRVADLPADALVTRVIDGSKVGMDGTITLYHTNSYLTIERGGKAVTLEVPEGARDSVRYLYFL